MRKMIFLSLIALILYLPTPIGAEEVFSSDGGFFTAELPTEIKLSAKDSQYPLGQPEIESWIKEKTGLIVEPDHRSEIENPDICLYARSLECRLTMAYSSLYHSKKVYRREPDQEAIARLVADIARKFNKDPEDAKLKMENGRVSAFNLSSPGIKLDEAKSIELIIKYFEEKSHDSNIIQLAYETVEPEISTDSIDNLGITTLIGEGRSNFAGSPRNRIYNIKVATNRFNGLLIKPGEEFSFVRHLGEVDAEHGYLPELVIKFNKTEPEYGGGICQVSTTAFRAAINSGLEITMRKNHAYPVSYYNPQGMDATVYVPRPDLRFLNDTPGHILIETKIEGTQLIFNFYGTSDGRRVNVIGPKITQRNPDGSMKATFTQEIFDKDGAVIRQDVFNSAYDSPNKYPHPTSEEVLTKKPKDWSDREWSVYKKAHGI